MATAILDLELSAPLEGLAVAGRYDRALILLRWRRLAVGSVTVPVREGRIARDSLIEAVRAATGKALWLRLAYERASHEPDLPPAPALPVTVAICTRDRPDDLRRALESLMRLPDSGQELIVVDNCPSSDLSRQIVSTYPRVRYILEPRAGLDVARNRALREASGDIVMFTDDDAVVEAEWLDAMRRNFGDPHVLCVTGLTMPLELETGAQEFFERHSPFGRGFRRVVFDGQRDNPLLVGRVGAGANMAVRRSILEIVGPFDEALDAGTPTRAGGDHEMFSRILAAGYRIVYDPAALSWHRHRRSFDELRDTFYGYGVGVYATFTRHLLSNRELGVLKLALGWFRHDQAPAVLRALRRRRDSLPLPLLLAELRGCLVGPAAYLRSRRQSAGRARG